MPGHLSIDIETYSSVDIRTGGLYKYVEAPDFQVLLFAYSFDGGPVEVIDLASGGHESLISLWLLNALKDPGVIKHAYNAAFEWYCLSKFLRYDPQFRSAWLSQWRCTMLHGLYCGYTAGLAATGAALGLPQDRRKLNTGGALIRTFCVPCKPCKANGGRTRTQPWHEPEKWELFKEYCRQDVVTEMEIERRLSAFPVPPEEQQLWELDQRINARGVGVDPTLVEGALYCSEQSTRALMAEAIGITGLQNPKSIAQLKEWLETEIDEEISDLQKGTVKELLAAEVPSDRARRMLEIRQELGKTSVKKYQAMQNAVCTDGRIRGLLQFYGANRTGRWAGRLVQVQNLPRNYLESLDHARECVKQRKLESVQVIYGSVPDTLSQLIRTAFVPSPGHRFVVADFSAIEARVIAWLAGEEWRQEVFRTHGKIYEASASAMFGVPIDKIMKGNPEYALRQKGKIAELALGYQGSAGALITMGGLQMGLTEAELPDIVQRWRSANRQIVGLWYAMEQAALETVATGRPSGARGILFVREYDPGGEQDFMTMRLPSGRKLYYARPYLTRNRWDKESFGYWGMDQKSRKWAQAETYGGKLVENCVQAIARDCLAVAIQRLEAAGYRAVMHIHDEVVLDMPEAAADLDAACAIMGQPIQWAPGLLLRADGFVSDYYKKD